MKLITVIVGVFTITTAIRVPPYWVENNAPYRQTNKFRTYQQQGSEIQSRPYVADKINSARKSQHNKRHHNLKNASEQLTAGSSTDWIPIFPPAAQNIHRFGHNHQGPAFEPPVFQKFGGDQNPTFSNFNLKTNFGLQPPNYGNHGRSPIYKNYRDDKTHEPTPHEESPKITSKSPIYKSYRGDKTHKPTSVAKDLINKKPNSPHENPSEVPTRPIYPGEGKWAKKATKHRPYINKQNSPHQLKKSPKKPEGYETFADNKNLFKQARKNFRNNIEEFPQKHSLGRYIEDGAADEKRNLGPLPEGGADEENQNFNRYEDGESSDVTTEFVPTKLYAQVRRSESEQHLPPEEAEDARLKEVVKDSKIQTVYTEEGYEDIAYDHAGHEKNAEQDEGFAEFDKEIEKKKKQEKANDDSEVAGSEYEVVGDPPVKVNKNNFITTKEVRMTAVKDKGDGNKEMEISSEIKVVVAPNNGTKTHKYLKIFPKVYRYDRIENDTATHPNNETKLPEMLPLESAMKSVAKTFFKTQGYNRFKRFVNDFPKLRVDTDFIDRIKHPDAPSTEATGTTSKYPYYNDPEINPDSPLRYSEDLGNIPKKSEDELAFYHQADRIECSEVEDDIDPIPERVKNAEARAEDMEETKDVQELAKSPRLGNLGDKIDCFKLKYFGENPLDSPIFDEATVAPVTPIFKSVKQKFSSPLVKKDLKRSQKENLEVVAPLVKKSLRKENLGNLRLVDQKQKGSIGKVLEETKEGGNEIEEEATTRNVDELGINILTDVIGKISTTPKIPPDVEIIDVKTIRENPPIEVAPVTIITTPKYTIDLQPKHIYDQIDLLQYLPILNSSEAILLNSTVFQRQGKNLEGLEDTTTNPTNQTINSELPTSQPINSELPTSQPINSELTISQPINSELPTSQPLLLRKRRRRIRPRRPPYGIFDVTRYLPAVNPYLDRYNQVTTVIPKYKILSEVHYKDEIRPDEQLNVFSDVINNIKNSTKDPLQLAASSDRIAVKLNTFHRIKVPPRVIHIKNSELNTLDNIEETNSFYLTTTTMRPKVTTSRGKKYSSQQTIEQFYEDLFTQDSAQYDNIELLKIDAAKTTTTTTKTPYVHQTSAPVVEVTTTEESEDEVLGLMPPKSHSYKTIFSPKLDKPLLKPMNYFYVQGMKPPSKQEVYSYSDFKLHNNGKMKQVLRRHRTRRSASHHDYSEGTGSRNVRIRRSASRPGYSEVTRNRNKPIDVDDDEEVVVEEDDDYVPHRPKNYHYDENTGRIVYENTKNNEEEEQEEVLEVTDAPLPKPTRRNPVTTPRFVDNSNEPSYVEYVKKLKSAANYVEIPDPTTTEKGEEVEEKVTTTTTSKPASTKPPEFLSILAKVRSDSGYKSIEDKKKSRTTTTTTEPPEEIIEESQVENVQNSPGGQSNGQNFQIFDINDYLPKIRTYTPTTSIDTSKYKTIERPSVPLRHNLSSRYNSEEESLEDVNTSRVPILMEKSEDNPTSESRNEEMTTTTTEVTTTTRKVRVKPRTRRPSTTAVLLVEHVASHNDKSRRPVTAAVSEVEHVTSNNDKSRRPVTTAVPVVEPVGPHHDKPRRVYPRKRPARIKLRTTTTPNEPDNDETEDTTKILRRRHQPELPRRQPKVVTPDEESSLPTQSNSSIPGRIEPRSVDSQNFHLEDRIDNFENAAEKPNSTISAEPETAKSSIVEDKTDDNVANDEKQTKIVTPEGSGRRNSTMPHRGRPRKIDDDVQVFQKYDETKKHGGNYKKENEDEGEREKEDGDVEESGDVKRLTDVVPKPIAFYTDPKLPKNVNQLMEVGSVGVEEINGEGGDDDEEKEEEYGDDDDDFEQDDEKKTTKTKKPVYVKDPSKRLYYYAPI